MPKIALSLNSNALLLLLLALLTISFSIVIYRHTVPPVPQSTKFFLVTLRSVAVFFIFLLLFEPILKLVTVQKTPPAVVLLIDDSKSMSLTDRLGNRAVTLRSLLSSNALHSLSDIAALKYYTFSDQLHQHSVFSRDSLKLNGSGTDISSALKNVQDRLEVENIQAVVLLTDGSYNLGQNPIYEAAKFSKPIYAVGVGDSSEQKDVLITKVLTNSIAYAESRVPVDVTVKSSGFNGERVEVSLVENGKVMSQQFLTLKSGTREYPVQLFFEPGEEGTKEYTVMVSKLAGEVTEKNNTKSFFVKILKSRLKVLLIAGAPSPDVAFIKRALVEDKNIQVKTLIQKNGAEFYEGTFNQGMFDPGVGGTDCLVLVDFPYSNSSTAVLQAIKSSIEQKTKPLFLVFGRLTDFEKLKTLEPLLPFTVTSINNEELSVFVQIPEAQLNNPIIKTPSGSSLDLWNKLPPIYKTQSILRAKPESDVIGLTKIQTVVTNEPLIVSRNVNRQKSLAVLGHGIWRWQLLAQSASISEDVFQPFIANSIRWLTAREEEKQVRFTPTKEIFTSGEPVEFIAQVYDAKYSPVDNAEVKIKIMKESQTYGMTLTPIGAGRYEGSLDPLPEGDYAFTGTAAIGGQSIGEDKGKFSVGELEVEFQDTRMNKALLEQIAQRSGGKYFDPPDFSNLVEELRDNTKLTPKEVSHTSEFELWNLSLMLIAIVLAFGTEWFIRKRSGML